MKPNLIVAVTCPEQKESFVDGNTYKCRKIVRPGRVLLYPAVALVLVYCGGGGLVFAFVGKNAEVSRVPTAPLLRHFPCKRQLSYDKLSKMKTKGADVCTFLKQAQFAPDVQQKDVLW